MVPANDLNRSGDLLQCCVVEGRVQDFQRVEECACLLRRDSAPALAHRQRVENFNCPERWCERLFASLEPSSTPIDESVCSSGKHQDKVTEASTTMRFKDAPRGAARGSLFRRAKDHGLCQSL